MAAAAAAVAALWAPAAAHVVNPGSITLRPGGRDYLLVQDATGCLADVTVWVEPPNSGVEIHAFDMATGQPIIGSGQSVTVNTAFHYFLVQATPDPTPANVVLRVCWSANPVTVSCTENNCPVGVTRPVTKKGDPETFGQRPESGVARDPVATRTRELFLPPRTLFAAGGPFPLEFAVHYASGLLADGNFTGTMGPNWSHNFAWQLATVGFNREIITPEGRVIRFEKGPFETAWAPAPYADVPYQLVESGSNTLLLDPIEQLVYTFNTTGQLTKIEDTHGNAHNLVYTTGRLTSVNDGLGRTISLTYVANKVATVAHLGRTWSLAYDGTGRLSTLTNPLAGVTTFAYDAALPAAALLTGVTEPRGNTPYTQTWDANRRVTTQSDASGNAFGFATNGLETSVSDPLGNAVTHRYDANDFFEAHVDETGDAMSFASDAAGRRVSVTDRLGATSSRAYHAPSGKIASVTEANGATTVNSYTPRAIAGGLTLHDLTSRSLLGGASESFSYDAGGNLVTYTDPGGGVWSATYNTRGQMLTLTNPSSGVRAFTYNPDGTLATWTNASGNAMTVAYDAFKRPVTIMHPGSASVQYTYDARDRVTSVRNELNGLTTYGYDANGNLTSVMTPSSATWTIAYDNVDRPMSVTDPLGEVAAATYDAFGRIASEIDPTLRTTTYGYDARGRLTLVTDPAGEAWARTHDDEAVLASASNPLGQTTALQSNAMGQFTAITNPLGQTAMASYDARSLPTSLADPGGTAMNMTWDEREDLESWSIPSAAMSASATRNALGAITALTDPRGNVWSAGYDGQGRRTSVTDPLGNTTSGSYDARGRLSQMTFPGGLGTANLTYDNADRLTRILYPDGSDYQYSYDADGRVTSAVFTGSQTPVATTFTYNARGDITSCNGIAMTYDDDGRLLSQTLAPGKSVTYTYDAAGRVATVSDWMGGATTFDYDAAGNLIRITRPNGAATEYTYDAVGRIVGISVSPPPAASKAATGETYTITVTRNANGDVMSEVRDLPFTPVPPPFERKPLYDVANRNQEDAYDALGRVTDTGDNTVDWYMSGHVKTWGERAIALGLRHDAFGGLASYTEGAESWGFTWNYAFDKPVPVVIDQNGVDLRYVIATPAGTPLYTRDAPNDARHDFTFDLDGRNIFMTNEAGAVTQASGFLPNGAAFDHMGTPQVPLIINASSGIQISDACVIDFGVAVGEMGRTLAPVRGAYWPVVAGLTESPATSYPNWPNGRRLEDDITRIGAAETYLSPYYRIRSMRRASEADVVRLGLFSPHSGFLSDLGLPDSPADLQAIDAAAMGLYLEYRNGADYSTDILANSNSRPAENNRAINTGFATAFQFVFSIARGAHLRPLDPEPAPSQEQVRESAEKYFRTGKNPDPAVFARPSRKERSGRFGLNLGF